jgi:predicted HTH transcriptional regulator
MAEEPAITIPEIAMRIGIGERAVKKNIANLQASGRLKRVGPDKGGHWEVAD